MELAIVMLNALMILSLFGGKQIPKIGMMIKVTMVPVVLNLIFGKLTSMLMLTLPIHAKFQEITVVKEPNVEMVLKDRMVFVIKMDVI